MQIENPRLIPEGDTIVLEAGVRCRGAVPRLPDRLWFRYPASWQPMLCQGIEPFVVALGGLASRIGETIDVDLPLSERLHAGMEEYWTILSQWFPKHLHPVHINCPGYTTTNPCGGVATGGAFSGGVDSFFTLFRHIAPQHPYPHGRMTHGIFVHGFDIPLTDERTYEIATAAYEPALASQGVSLVRVKTNLRQFVEGTRWEIAHGSALCGTAMTLSGGLRQFLVPSSLSYSSLRPWGSDPMTDPLLSTEQFSVVHDGAAFTRFDKLHAMRDWQLLRPLLRTCWKRPDGLRNCGRCENCRQTMMILAALGVLHHFETFPPIRSNCHFLLTRWTSPHERIFGKQTICYAASHNRGRLSWIGRLAMGRSFVRRILKGPGLG